MKTSLRKCRESISGSPDTAAPVLKDTIKALDKAASKGIIGKNTAARRKSRLTKSLTASVKAAAEAAEIELEFKKNAEKRFYTIYCDYNCYFSGRFFQPGIFLGE